MKNTRSKDRKRDRDRRKKIDRALKKKNASRGERIRKRYGC